jgi:hypothetical protein
VSRASAPVTVEVEVDDNDPPTPSADDTDNGESFESARPVEPREFAVASEEPPAPASSPNPAAAPALADAVAKIPATTRALLSELFKAEIKAVRPLDRNQLR